MCFLPLEKIIPIEIIPYCNSFDFVFQTNIKRQVVQTISGYASTAYNKHLNANMSDAQRTCNFCQWQHNQPAIVSWLRVISSDKV